MTIDDPIQTAQGPIAPVMLAHPTHLPVYRKVRHYERHPREGPPMALLSGGSGAKALSEMLIRYTHHTSHILPVFDDGGSSRVLREAFSMPPPGDLRNRLMALSDMTRSGNPEVSRLFRTRLPAVGDPEHLEAELASYLDESHPQMQKIEARYRRIIVKHLERFVDRKPPGFDLRRGNIGNFVITGSYLAVGDLESVIFELTALAAVRGAVYPVCAGGQYHLKATFHDGTELVGQSRITGQQHPAIRDLAIVEQVDDRWVETRPPLNPLVERAIGDSMLIAYTMGSFYTSLVPSLLVEGIGRAIRRTRRPKVFVANLVQDRETPGMTTYEMLGALWRALQSSDTRDGDLGDYVHYALVGTHGNSTADGRVAVDLAAIRDMGVEPIVLPLEKGPGLHDPEMVAAVLLSLC